jgi:hypothetical protein
LQEQLKDIFIFLCQRIGVTATQALTCRPILSRHYASMMQDGLQIAGPLGGWGGLLAAGLSAHNLFGSQAAAGSFCR